MRRLLTIFTLLAGLFLILLGGQYLLSLYGLIDVPPPDWIGGFVNDLFGLGVSAVASQIVAWTIAIFGCIMIVTGTYYLRKSI